MEKYPAYRIEDFTRKSFIQGGLTLSQTKILYQLAQNREAERFKLLHKMVGFGGTSSTTISKNAPLDSGSSTEKPIFLDPAEYENMSEEERKELTRKMKSQLSLKLSGLGSVPGMKSKTSLSGLVG